MNDASLTRRLASDNRGAVMLTGLFMSFFLVGCLWFVMGVGNAVIFRDRMQEAADHAAFSSAALHAKGMNFISACNLVMLVMVIVHIVLGIIHDFALAACILTLGAGCGGWVGARKAYTGYAGFMKPILSGIHIAEEVAAYGYPWLGTVKGLQIGGKYGNQGRAGDVTVVTLGESNIPGALLGGANHGLPVGPKPMNFLCEKVVGMIWDFGKKIAGDTLGLVGTVLNTVSGWLGRETISEIVEKLLREGVKLRYCNDLTTVSSEFRKQFKRGQEQVYDENKDDEKNNDGKNQREIPNMATKQSYGGWSSSLDPGFDKGWGQDGPLMVNDGVSNGKHQMWVFAVNLGPKYNDDNERRVTLAKGPTPSRGGLAGPKGAAADQQAFGYIAQAEFYYDCHSGWGDQACNGESNDANASFGIRWKARLRRIKLPNLGELLANFAMDRILNSDAYKAAKDTIESTIRGLATGPLSAVGLEALNTWVSEQIGKLEGQVRDTVTGAASNFDPLPKSYH
jgi:hypothetical protein